MPDGAALFYSVSAAVRHRDDFLPVEATEVDEHDLRPAARTAASP
ncbi:Uncharacterised protein [Nocardia africana]|uniref:Uncharacterized protein n=1 Tax=Nocardia africana TaxID=134964 RepID=A0A378WLP8_9NOCA|nr:Uncharacterised protein [Nocardia africana]